MRKELAPVQESHNSSCLSDWYSCFLLSGKQTKLIIQRVLHNQYLLYFEYLSLHILCTGRCKIGHHFPKFIKFSCFLILHQCDYCVMEFKLIESKEPFCGICFLNAGNKKTVCLDENHFNQNKLFFIFTLILFYENN